MATVYSEIFSDNQLIQCGVWNIGHYLHIKTEHLTKQLHCITYIVIATVLILRS
jgi:hypothetical protein